MKKFKRMHIDDSLIKNALGKALGMPSGSDIFRSDLFRNPSKGLAISFIFSLIVHKKIHLQILHIKRRIKKKNRAFS